MAKMMHEVDRNYEEFHRILPSLLSTNAGQYVLLHDGRVAEFFGSLRQAVTEGIMRFGHGNYSVQEISARTENLGFYSYAGGTMQA